MEPVSPDFTFTDILSSSYTTMLQNNNTTTTRLNHRTAVDDLHSADDTAADSMMEYLNIPNDHEAEDQELELLTNPEPISTSASAHPIIGLALAFATTPTDTPALAPPSTTFDVEENMELDLDTSPWETPFIETPDALGNVINRDSFDVVDPSAAFGGVAVAQAQDDELNEESLEMFSRFFDHYIATSGGKAHPQVHIPVPTTIDPTYVGGGHGKMDASTPIIPTLADFVTPTTPYLASPDNVLIPSPIVPSSNVNIKRAPSTFPSPLPATASSLLPTGTRRNTTPSTLLSLDAPTQARTYASPSATSRKAVPAFAKNMVGSGSGSGSGKRKRGSSTLKDVDGEGDADEYIPATEASGSTSTSAPAGNSGRAAKKARTSKKEDTSAAAAAEDSTTPDPSLDPIEAKRRQNTIAARRSRHRKLAYKNQLESENARLNAENEALKGRVGKLEGEMRRSGVDVPVWDGLPRFPDLVDGAGEEEDDEEE